MPVAATPDPGSAAPVTGNVGECQVTFDYAMSVQRIREYARVTKPYTEAQWSRIQSLGRQVDAELLASDVRLTMGGEPTFVSIDDMEGPEWNTTALGPDKRLKAEAFFAGWHAVSPEGPCCISARASGTRPSRSHDGPWGAIRARTASPSARPELLADDECLAPAGQPEAESFIQSLARRLRVDPGHVVSAYEDVWYVLWKERRLPVNVDPLASNLDDPLERDRIAKILQRGLNAIVGYALPIRPRQESGGLRWESGRWFFRDEQMFLIPGDSPMGLRLPLDSLPWLVPEDRPVSQERDPFDPRGVLPSLEQLRTGAWSRGNGAYSGQATDPWGDTALRRRAAVDGTPRLPPLPLWCRSMPESRTIR